MKSRICSSVFPQSLFLLILIAFCSGCAQSNRPTFLDRPDEPHVRVMCYNVNWDAIFPDGDPLNHRWRSKDRRAAFDRVVKAIRPDIVCIQEINPRREAQQVADILNEVIPAPDRGRWGAFRARDNFIATRFPMGMTGSDTIPSTDRGHAMALVDLPDAFTRDLYLICAHFKSAGGPENIARRQTHADAIVHWIRDAKTPGGSVDLPAGTPIVVLGDLNVYNTDPHHHLTTLLTGDIADEQKFGPDAKPDWDDTDLADALPKHNGAGPETWTWRNDGSQFTPFPLDRIIYTDSAMGVLNAFALNTTTLTEEQLKAAGLEKDDVVLDPETGDFDHIPLVVDFAIRPAKASR